MVHENWVQIIYIMQSEDEDLILSFPDYAQISIGFIKFLVLKEVKGNKFL